MIVGGRACRGVGEHKTDRQTDRPFTTLAGLVRSWGRERTRQEGGGGVVHIGRGVACDARGGKVVTDSVVWWGVRVVMFSRSGRGLAVVVVVLGSFLWRFL